MSLKLQVKQITNPKLLGYPLWYSHVKYEKQIMDIDDLAQHMADHNTPYSKGVIRGILTDFVYCVREQALLGRRIRIDGLALFKLAVSTKGAETFQTAKQRSMIKRVMLKIFPNGEFTSAELASTPIEWMDVYDPTAPAPTPTPEGSKTPDSSGQTPGNSTVTPDDGEGNTSDGAMGE